MNSDLLFPHLAEADHKLLLAIIATNAVPVDYAAVAATMGNICTPRAVQERLKKLKKVGTEKAGADLTPSALTPKKVEKSAKTGAGPSSTKKAAASKGKAKLQSEENTEETTHGTQAGDSEASTEINMEFVLEEQDIDSGTPAAETGFADAATEETTNSSNPTIKTRKGKAKARATTAEKKPRTNKAKKATDNDEKTLDKMMETKKVRAKPEKKILIASGTGKGKAGKSQGKSGLGADDGTRVVTAEQGVKRKREIEDEGTVDGEVNYKGEASQQLA